MKRIFSGVQPTGNLHLGNFLGAIRNWVKLQKDFECIFCVVDLHAITVPQDPKILISNTKEVTAAFLAAGIDSKSTIIFNQSSVSGHAELTWILNSITPLGWLNRMTQFKEKSGKKRENASLGLYGYPVLMAADILLYLATHVPVGDDQKQHLELVRDIAGSFNSFFGVDFFPFPEPQIFGEATRVMFLRDGMNKMSKSDPSDYSRINLTDTADEIAQKIKKAKTDSDPLPDLPDKLKNRPEALNLLGIYAALSDSDLDNTCKKFSGKLFSDFKNDLADLAVSVLSPISDEMRRMQKDESFINQILKSGSEKAKEIAEKNLREIKKIVGFFVP